jgi:ABC-type nitrate/sulfonate/bicarbonate transport system permease component
MLAEGQAIVEPSLEALRSLPKVALVPALILLVGIGNATNIVCIALAGVFPIWINVVAGVRRIDPVLHDSAVMLGMGRLSRLQKIVLPAVLPDIFAGVRIAMGICFVVAVLSEMTIGSDGLGSLIIDMQRSFRVRHMYAWIVILAALGVALNALIAVGERHIVFWTRHANQNG